MSEMVFAYIFIPLVGLCALIWGIFIEKSWSGRIFGVLAVICAVIEVWTNYTAARNAANAITSASVQLNITVHYNDSKFKDISITENPYEDYFTVDSSQNATTTLPPADHKTIDMVLAFGKNQTSTLIVASRDVYENTMGPNDLRVSSQLDLLAAPQVSLINGGLSDLEKSKWIEFNIPDPFEGATFTEGGFTQSGIATSTVIVSGTIDLNVNGKYKAEIQIPSQSASILPAQNSVVNIPITFPSIDPVQN